MKNYQVQSPVLFLIFNRPDTTKMVFQAIRSAKPARLYIAADGPRAERPEEQTLCAEALTIVSNIDWKCEVKTFYRKENLGCKQAVSTAIDWFFQQEEEGIILEDDCLPALDFFKFCDEMLTRYRFDTRIRHIAGCNLQHGRKYGKASYYFTHQTHVWGWASWRRVWQNYDKTLSAYEDQQAAEHLDKIFDDPFVAREWKTIFREVKKGAIDTWDYQLALINFFNNSLSINPNVNLIKNLGFRADGTHTTSTENPYGAMELENLDKIIHPLYILPEKQAELEIYKLCFDLEEKWKQHNRPKKRFKRWLKTLV